MQVYFGYDDEHYVNITKEVFAKCLKDNGIFIPAGDPSRCDIIGYDPFPNTLKHILIIDSNNNTYKYNFTKEVVITFEPISQQLANDLNPKVWWNNTGKFITDHVERLNALQKKFNLVHTSWGGGFELEYPEQLMCMRYVNENAKVLEIGGNIGRTSHIIQTILNNPLNHVIMECDNEIAKQLRTNLDANTFTQARIETAALSVSKLYQDGGHGPRPIEDFQDTENPIEVPTISYSQICQKYGVDFDTLVADCEGSLFYIFKEDPNMLDRVNTVIMENDYHDLDHKQMVDAILTIKGFHCVYQEKGVPWASWSCCYEYFYEVWSK